MANIIKTNDNDAPSSPEDRPIQQKDSSPTNKEGTILNIPEEDKIGYKEEKQESIDLDFLINNPEDEFNGYDLMMRKVTSIPMLVSPIFQKTGLCAIAGTSDAGKSSFLKQLSVAICSGDNDFLGFKINPKYKSVIYLSSEDDSTATAYYMWKISKHTGENNAFRRLRFIFDFDNAVDAIECKLKNKPADLVIIDAFTDIFTKDMNQSNEVRTFLKDFNDLAMRHQCCIVFLHHTGKRTDGLKPSKHNLLGSQGFEAKMRSVSELKKDESNGTLRHLCVVKGNYINQEEKSRSYVLNFDDMFFVNTGERIDIEELGSVKKIKITKEVKADVLEMKNTNKSQTEIAEILGISQAAVSKIMNEK